MHQLLYELDKPALWNNALEGIAHPYAFRWEYCNAMAKSSGLKVQWGLGGLMLFTYKGARTEFGSEIA